MVNAQNALVHNLTVNTLNTQAYPQPCWEGWSNCARARRLAFKRWWAVLWPGKSHGGALCAAVHGVAKSRTRLSDFTFTFHFHALEREMATHFSVLAWRIPGTGEPGGLPSMGLHRVGHDWSDLAAAAAAGKLLEWLSKMPHSNSSDCE